jgi:putative acetyltransferase
MLPEVLPLRRASRELVRELGFLQAHDRATKLSHSHCHALLEIEARGELAQSELPGLLRLEKSTASRIVTELETRGWLKAQPSAEDRRARVLVLTPRGRSKVAEIHQHANARVEQALATLPEDQRRSALLGMQIYARALERSRRAAQFLIRPMRASDREGVASLIRTVMPEFGAKGPGFAINDPEVDDMYTAYAIRRAAYFVVVRDEDVVGGGGFAPLVGGDARTCELRKMYFLPDLRGLGIGQKVLDLCIAGARRERFTTMYLETLSNMTQARALYERNGFRRLDRAMGETGHFGCNTFYALDLR